MERRNPERVSSFQKDNFINSDSFDFDLFLRVFTSGQSSSRCLGVDFGERNVGVSIADLLLKNPSVCGIYRNNKDLLDSLCLLVLSEQVNLIIFGAAIKLSGAGFHPIFFKTLSFANNLQNILLEKYSKSISYFFFDERMTSSYFKKNALFPKNKKIKTLVDDLSSLLILTNAIDFIDHKIKNKK